jgi:23S rRNA pseudouridine2605 synthase
MPWATPAGYTGSARGDGAMLTFAIMPKAAARHGARWTLDRLLSKAGAGSRTEARRWIAERRVEVNGTVVTNSGRWIDPALDRVALDGQPLRTASKIYLLLHKPKGYLTTYRDPRGRRTVYDLLPERDRFLFPVGRLDLDSSGLLVMTNDSAFAETLTNPERKVPKTYLVKASRPLTDPELDRLRAGVTLRDGTTRSALLRRVPERGGGSVFEITIAEGKNRQVRRMVQALDAKVVRLVRVAIGGVRIGDLPAGAVRPLLPGEIRRLLGTASPARSR